jgi:POT family proton-dependent oligopeptide transporter
VIILAPVFAWLWVKLGKREPESPMKFAVGLLLVGVGMVVMIPAARLAVGGTRVSPGWLVTLYFIHTCGELCLSPVGLSSMTRLAPPKIGGMVMGIWFLAASIGNYLSGRTAGMAAKYPFSKVLIVLAAVALVAAAVMFLLAKPMTRMMGTKANGGQPAH